MFFRGRWDDSTSSEVRLQEILGLQRKGQITCINKEYKTRAALRNITKNNNCNTHGTGFGEQVSWLLVVRGFTHENQAVGV